jgi:hypothetical protein
MRGTGLVLLALLLCICAVVPAVGRDFYQLNRADWVNDGLVLGGGNHEAFIFRIRRGGAGPYDVEWRKWLSEHSEKTVTAAKRAGIEVFHSHGYKGFGYEAEKDEMKLLASLSKLVHKQGMKLDTYSQVMTLVPETFFVEEPSAENWVQRMPDGTPILLTYGYQQSYRYKPSMIHPGYREYYKEKILRTLIQQCDTDLIHFDNFDCNPEPESDRSPTAVKAFRSYLENKYPTDSLRIERFGHTDFSYVNPPMFNNPHPPGGIGVIRDPVQQEWVDFRCWAMTDWLREMVEFAKELKPTVAIDVNPHGLFGRNRAYQTALWHPWFMKYTEVIWSEEQNTADYNEKGVVVSKIRTFKMGRTLDNWILTYKGTDRQHAENLAFNQTLGNVGLGEEDTPNDRYHKFYLKYRNYYTGTENREDAALLRSYATMAYDNHRAALEQCMFEQAMIQGQVPFDLVFDEQMDDLNRYRVIVLAGQNNLADEHIERIERFVDSGGGLVVTGMSGSRDHWGRLRTRPGLAVAMSMNAGWNTSSTSYNDKITSSRGGRVVYVPEIIAPDPELAAGWTGSWDGHEGSGPWILPVNSRDLERAVRNACGGKLSVEVDAPEWVVVEQTRKDKLIMVHLVNYRERDKQTSIPLDVLLDKGRKVRSVRVHSPDRAAEQSLEYSVEDGRVQFVVPELKVYDLIVIEQS